MKFSNPDSSLRASWCANQCDKQVAEDGAQVVAPVEPELHLGQVAVGVLGELDGVVRAGERGLHVADEGVDGLELVVEDAGLAAAGDLTVVDRASAGGDLEAVQAIGHQVLSLLQSARLNGLDPYNYIKDVLTRLPTQPAGRIEELLPHRWQPGASR
jgi:hypothetical protein